jgi:hypothetical protein
MLATTDRQQKLIPQLRDTLNRLHYSRNTEQTYV